MMAFQRLETRRPVHGKSSPRQTRRDCDISAQCNAYSSIFCISSVGSVSKTEEVVGVS